MMTSSNLLLYILLSTVTLIGCTESQPNFLLDEFPELVANAWEDKALLKKFKETPFDIVITQYPEYSEAFNKAGGNILLINGFETKYRKSLDENELSFNDTSNILLLLAILHKKLNRVSFNLSELKEQTDLIYMKTQLIEQSDNYVDFQVNDCNVKLLIHINKWLLESSHRINYIDADIIIKASRKSCRLNIEFSQLYNETLFNFFKNKPTYIIELLEEGKYPDEFFELMNEALRNPISDEIDLDLILKKLKRLRPSKSRNQFINSIEFAILKR